MGGEVTLVTVMLGDGPMDQDPRGCHAPSFLAASLGEGEASIAWDI